MNNTIVPLANGDFKVLPTARKEPGLPAIEVKYKDLFLGRERTRDFDDLGKALEFVKMRAWQPHLYNEFHITVRQPRRG